MNKKFCAPFAALALVLFLCAPVLADTIRLKDGSVIRGQVVGFKDQQFTVLIGGGTRGGRRSRITLYMEDVESIEFDSATTAAPGNEDTSSAPVSSQPARQEPQPSSVPDTVSNPPRQQNTQPTGRPAPTFQINVRVRGDSTTNGWTNSGLVVKRGQRIRITSSGRITIGNGRTSTPTGLPTVADRDKLMRNDPTGGLIAVIGDDNDDFIFVGSNREFIAQRDGVLFLGVNEGNLTDNSGAYDVVIEAEAVAR